MSMISSTILHHHRRAVKNGLHKLVPKSTVLSCSSTQHHTTWSTQRQDQTAAMATIECADDNNAYTNRDGDVIMRRCTSPHFLSCRSSHSLTLPYTNSSRQYHTIINSARHDNNHHHCRPEQYNKNNRSTKQHQQLISVRHMGRKDRASAFSKPRPPSKKQRKRYHKRMREQYEHQVGRHSKPGSKAGPLREYEERERQYYLDKAQGKLPEVKEFDELDFDLGDAIIDDLIGNSSYLTSSPTPQPKNMGHTYEKHHAKISKIMNTYFEAQEALKQIEDGDGTDNNTNDITQIKDGNEEKKELQSTPTQAIIPKLPSDKQISLLLRSYRDRQTFSKSSKPSSKNIPPLGIVKALQHLLTDMQIPVHAFGPRTYTALVKCASSPTEARRIFKLMEDNDQPIRVHDYSILVVIHAKRGDFRGAKDVMDEMVFEGLTPTLAAYTSLMAGCYRVLNTGAMPRDVKIEAGKLGWDTWKEMRIRGINADVMAYGAIIRIMAARGQPERSLNLIDEMPVFEVKPTTLIFTSALKAVARSHANALRFEGGRSIKNKHREKITSHHGKMARMILIKAEQAEVTLDDGFMSALMLCAGTAGDVATVKAIYLAQEIRELEMNKRNESNYFQLLQGEGNPFLVNDGQNDTMKMLMGGANNTTGPNQVIVPENDNKSEAAVAKDSRRHTALLHANSCALEKKGLGNMWAGAENKGYLCANSLRLLVARVIPQYVDNSLPGLGSVDAGLSTMEFEDEDDKFDKTSKKLRRKKFEFKQRIGGNTLDDLDPEYAEMMGAFDDDYNEGKSVMSDKALNTFLGIENDENEEDLEITVGEEEDNNKDDEFSNTVVNEQSENLRSKSIEHDNEINAFSINDQNTGEEDLFDEADDEDDISADEDLKKLLDGLPDDGGVEQLKEMFSNDNFKRMLADDSSGDGNNLENFEDLFDDKEMQELLAKDADSDDDDTDLVDIDDFLEDFQKMSGKDNDELKQLLGNSNSGGDQDLDKLFAEFQEDDGEEFEEIDFNFDNEELLDVEKDSKDNVIDIPTTDFREYEGHKQISSESTDQDAFALEENVNDLSIPSLKEDSLLDDTSLMDDKDELDLVLQGFPEKRIEKVRNVISSDPGLPSVLKLVPILRENMPEYITRRWLKQKNMQDANVVLRDAEEKGLVDMYVLNSMLQVLTKAGNLDRAIAFHEEEFRNRNLEATAYGDRIVLQMLVDNKRVSRALQFKTKMESSGKTMDLLSYGSLIEHYGNHRQLGSALMTLKECISVHGSRPPEKNIKKLRLVCRQEGVDHEEDIKELLGDDPLQWAREGEQHLKREMSYKGRRQTNLVRNRLVSA